jgi:hypothetical protein
MESLRSPHSWALSANLDPVNELGTYIGTK